MSSDSAPQLGRHYRPRRQYYHHHDWKCFSRTIYFHNYICLVDNNFIFNPMSQELLATLSLIITVNHFQLEIKTMMMAQTETVPSCFMEPGGTQIVTRLT